jgi:hypothetical protein
MSYEQRDNTGGMWTSRGYQGNAKVNGEMFSLTMTATQAKRDGMPIGIAALNNRDRGDVAALFKPKSEGSKAVATGVFKTLGVRINLYKNEKRSDASPDYGVQFMDIENQEPHPPQEEETQDNDTPF